MIEEIYRHGKTTRRDEMLRRARIDPVRVDTRPLSAIMDDFIPYEKWEKQSELMRRAGYRNHQELLLKWSKKNAT